MNLCSATVWYNPDKSCVENILTYSSAVGKCYIIDNSSFDNGILAAQIKNCVYISNLDNLGIATALNIGCKKALADGFEWCMTMDQDSSWEQTELEKYLTAISSLQSDVCVSFVPVISFSNYGERTTKITKDITSGNIICLSAWKSVGKFYEPFFIDEVDFEFCYRLLEAGYEITQINSAYMKHQLGVEKKSFLPLLRHNGLRLYYMIRNILFIKKLHPHYFKSEKYSRLLFKRIFRITFEGIFCLRLKNILYLIRAVLDYKKNHLGKFDKPTKIRETTYESF